MSDHSPYTITLELDCWAYSHEDAMANAAACAAVFENGAALPQYRASTSQVIVQRNEGFFKKERKKKNV